MTASTVSSIPSSVVVPDTDAYPETGFPETWTCPGCGVEDPADTDHFFPHRASGGLHLKSKHGHRACEAAYRADAKARLTAGTREVRPRGSRKAAIEAENQAAAVAAEVAYVGTPGYENGFPGYVPAALSAPAATTPAATPTRRSRGK